MCTIVSNKFYVGSLSKKMCMPVRTGGPADLRKTITNASIINMPRLSFVEHKNSTNLF
jgi:hypothetical protein